MRIVIDMQACQSPFSGTRGVGRYTTDLVTALLQRSRGHEVYLALNGAFVESVERLRAEFGHLVPQDRFLVWQNHLTTQYVHGGELRPPRLELVRAAEVVREAALNSVEPHVIFAPNLQEGFSDPAVTSVKVVPSDAIYATTLHDLTPFHFAKELLRDEFVRRWYLEKVDFARKSDLIITDSQASKQDIDDLLNVDAEKVHPIYCGYNKEIFRADYSNSDVADALDRLALPDEFVFYFGGNDLCKNVHRLIEAHARLPLDLRSKFPLVLGGRSFKYDPYGNSHVATQDLIAELGVSDTVLTPGFVDDRDLPLLLQACSCFVFPSTHEGFGLPALEAMACGAPVIGSNRSSVAEVIGQPEAWFDPYDIADICSKLEQALLDETWRASLRQHGLARSKSFSWHKAADELLDLFEVTVEAQVERAGRHVGEPLRGAINRLVSEIPALDGPDRVALARMLDETFPAAGKPTLHIDVSTLVIKDDRSGIQRVTRAVAAGMLAAPPQGWNVELVWSTPHEPFFFAANAFKSEQLGLTAPRSDNYIAFKPGDILLFLDQAPSTAISHADYIRELRAAGVRVYFYVYDLIPLNHSEWFTPGGVEEFQQLMETVLTGDGAICCSKATADDVSRFAAPRLAQGRLPFRIGYAHLGAEIDNSVPSRGLPDDAETTLAALNARPSFAMVGTLEPRKGHRQVLSAFELLWARGVDINLVIVGRYGWKMGEFDKTLREHPEYGNRLFWLSGISDEFLQMIYAASSCLIAASEAEGFGLPLIEAAHHGLPILARDLPVFREVAGRHAAYFLDSLNPQHLANSVLTWLVGYKNGRHTKSASMPALSWCESVQRIYDVLLGGDWLYELAHPRPALLPEHA